MDTVGMCLKANIPLNKLDDGAVRSYLNKYVKGYGDLPTASRLRNAYAPKCGEKEQERVTEMVKDKPIVVVADETSDSKGGCVFAILFRTNTATATQDVNLASCSFLGTANGTTTSQAIIEALLKYKVDYSNVEGLVSDSARYMGTCFAGLKVLVGEHLIHYQCWAHKINLIADVIMKELAELNQLVTKVKMAFLHGRCIKSAWLECVSEHYPDLPAKLFPSPVVTRWNSCLKSVVFLSTYLDALVHFLNEYERKNSSGTAVTDMFEDASLATTLKIQCIFVADFATKHIIELIETLEGSKYPFAHLLWNRLICISDTLKRNSDGSFSEPVLSSFSQIENAIAKVQVIEKLKQASQKANNKLGMHMVSTPANELYKSASTLFDPAVAGQRHAIADPILISNKKKLGPSTAKLTNDDFLDGYKYFHRELVNLVKEEETVDVLQSLLATRSAKPAFANAAIKVVWSPVNSVDAERFFSAYNLTLTDRRTRMKEENLETCAMLSFNHK